MSYRKLCKWVLKVSELSPGAWVTFGDVVKGKETIREIVTNAHEGGVNFFDNADVYVKVLAEEIMGEVLKEFRRHTLVLSTKAYWPMSEDHNDRGLSRKHLMEISTQSLKRQKTEQM
ncbi:aldo/keto reductase, partial [Thermus scotoductus]